MTQQTFSCSVHPLFELKYGYSVAKNTIRLWQRLNTRRKHQTQRMYVIWWRYPIFPKEVQLGYYSLFNISSLTMEFNQINSEHITRSINPKNLFNGNIRSIFRPWNHKRFLNDIFMYPCHVSFIHRLLYNRIWEK